VNPAVISLAFDPIIHLGETSSVRLETIALAAILLAGLVLAAVIGRRTPAVGPYVPAPGLRPDDLIFIAIGAIPGAAVGARLGYVLDHLDYYRAAPDKILDLTQGGLSLSLAVPLGMLTAILIARLIHASAGRWMHAAAAPLLLVLAAGKLAGVLGATGQGLPADLPWATAYAGAGPWNSLGASIPAHPSQVYEGLATVVALVVLVAASRVEIVARRDGAALFVALASWSVLRVAVGFTWRDPVVLGPFRMEQLLTLIVLGVAVVGLVERSRAPLGDASGLSDRSVGLEPAG